MRRAHQRGDVADRTDVDLAARQEGDGARQVDREAALDAAEDDAGDALAVVERCLQLLPGFLAARLVAAQHGLAVGVFHALDEHLDGVADLDVGRLARRGELAQRDAAFGFEADVDQRHVIVDGDDASLDDGAFEGVAAFEALVEHRGEIFDGRHGAGGCGIGHGYSVAFRCYSGRPVGSGGLCQAPAPPARPFRTSKR